MRLILSVIIRYERLELMGTGWQLKLDLPRSDFGPGSRHRDLIRVRCTLWQRGIDLINYPGKKCPCLSLLALRTNPFDQKESVSVRK